MPVRPSEMPAIVSHLRRVLTEHRKERIVEARDRLVYNFGRASHVAAEQIEELYRRELDAELARRSSRSSWWRRSAAARGAS